MRKFSLLALLLLLCSTSNLWSQCTANFLFSGDPFVLFLDNSSAGSGSITSWVWDFGDGNSSTNQNPSNNYSSNGNYTVCLIITTSTSCTDTICKSVVVSNVPPPPCIANWGVDTSGCPSFVFSDSSTLSSGSIVQWFWNFGDGNTSGAQNPTHVFTADGTYNVCLGIQTSTACNDFYCDSVTVNCISSGFCNASFTIQTNLCPTIRFFDASTTNLGTIRNYSWDFGDGGTDTLINTMHTYTSSGTYTVCLAIETSMGCRDTFCTQVPVTCFGVQCTSAYSYTQNLGCGSYNFTSSASAFPGTVTNYAWDFGDGNSSAMQNPGHNFATNGSFPVCLTITTSDSCITTFCDTISITCHPSTCNMVYSYAFSPSCPTLQFTDLSTASPGTIVAWNWSFGDGNTSTLQNPSHTYALNGTYTVSLNITTSDSCSAGGFQFITISCITGPACVAQFSPSLANCPLAYFFDGSASSPGTINSWSWSFGDGGTSNLQNPTHSYIANGLYNVCLTITTNDLCTDTYCDTLDIQCITPATCNANFSANTSTCAVYTFTDSSNSAPGAITSWTWDFGDGSGTSTQSPNHTYIANGVFNVCLTIMTADSCISTFCDSVTITCIAGVTCQSIFTFDNSNSPSIVFGDASVSSPGNITSWAWAFGDGGNSSGQNPTYTYSTPGSYEVCLTIMTSDSCSDNYCDTIEVLVGREREMLNQYELKVFPNPAHTIVNVQFFLTANEMITFSLYDMSGKLIERKSLHNLVQGRNDLSINTLDFREGIYFLHLNGEEASVVRKIIIRH